MANQVKDDAAVRDTSDWMAAIRHRESQRADAYLVDQFAHLLAGRPEEELVARLEAIGGPSEVVLTRGRIGDGLIASALADGVRQVAILAAGSDTRAWRLNLASATVFELDLPGQVEAKIATLAYAGGRPTGRHVAVDADLRDDWVPAILKAGLAAERRTIWLVEGLFYYFTPAASDRLLRDLSAISPPGSRLALDVPHTGYASRPANAEFLAYMAERGSPFVGAVADPIGWLAGHGWAAEAYLAGELRGCRLVPAPPQRLVHPERPIWHVVARRT